MKLRSIIRYVNIKDAILNGILKTEQVLPFIDILNKEQVLDLIMYGKMSEQFIGRHLEFFKELNYLRDLLEYNQFSTKFLEKHMARSKKCRLGLGTVVTSIGHFNWSDISKYQLADTNFWVKHLQNKNSYDFNKYWIGWEDLPQEQLDEMVLSLLKSKQLSQNVYFISELFSYDRITTKVIEENVWIFDIQDGKTKKSVRDELFNNRNRGGISTQLVEAVENKPEAIAPISYLKERMYEVNYANYKLRQKYKRKLWYNLSEKTRKLIWKDSISSVDLDTTTYCCEYFAKPPETIETMGEKIPDTLVDFFVSKFGGAALTDKVWFKEWLNGKPIKAFG